MWSISEIKARAHRYMDAAYWRSVLAALVNKLVTCGIAAAVMWIGLELILQIISIDAISYYYQFDMGMMGIGFETFIGLAYTVFILAIVLIVAGFCIGLFVMTPIEVGCKRFFIVNHAMPGRTKSGELFHVFSSDYLHVVGVMLLKDIYLTIWALLLPAIAMTACNILTTVGVLERYLPVWIYVPLAFPALIKLYSYRLVPYILAEEPGMPAGDVITLSRRMMKGSKWHAFLLDLSFIGWDILNVCTLFILGVFYVGPYKQTTKAEMYITIRDAFLRAQHNNA